MNEVKVKKEDLLKRIEKNRDNHRTVFLKACDGYRKQAIFELDKMLNEATGGQRIRRYIDLIEPEDHTRDYDRIIDMLNMSNDEIISLSSRDFARYVRDEWDWLDQFNNSTMSYLKHE